MRLAVSLGMNAKGGDEMTYDEHLAFLIRQERGARAERQGFLDAKSFPQWTKPVNFTKDEKEQRRYNLGWENGKTMLKVENAEEYHL
jgi:hypothetical protein